MNEKMVVENTLIVELGESQPWLKATSFELIKAVAKFSDYQALPLALIRLLM